MKKEHVAFLLGGFAFGALFGAGLVNAIGSNPEAGAAGQAATMQAPAGPMAPTQVGNDAQAGGAPMMAQINDLKRRLQTDANDLGALVRLANLYHDVGMWPQAIEYYERALEVRPNDPNLLTDMGVCYRGEEKFDRALELFEQAANADPKHWQSRFNAAVVNGFDLGNYDRALAVLDSVETLDPPPPNLTELRHALEQARAEAQRGGAS